MDGLNNGRELTLEEAAKALAATAERAGALMKQEAQRAREEAARVRSQIQTFSEQMEQTRHEVEVVRQTTAVTVADARAEIEESRKFGASSISDAKGETDKARRNAGRAWASVGVMGFGVVMAVGWCTSTLTRNDSELGHLKDQVTQWRSTAAQREGQIGSLRGELEGAKVAQARAEGELSGLAGTRNGGVVHASASPLKVDEKEKPLPQLSETDDGELLANPQSSNDEGLVEQGPPAPEQKSETKTEPAPTTPSAEPAKQNTEPDLIQEVLNTLSQSGYRGR
jgi:phage shock protein A